MKLPLLLFPNCRTCDNFRILASLYPKTFVQEERRVNIHLAKAHRCELASDYEIEPFPCEPVIP